MNVACLRRVLSGALLCLPLLANAAMTDAEAGAMVKSMLEEKKSADEIIQALIDDGRSLRDATVLAVQNSAGNAQYTLGMVGICRAVDATKAEEVGKACANECSKEVQELVDSLIEGYVTGACQPPAYEYFSSPASGGSISQSN